MLSQCIRHAQVTKDVRGQYDKLHAARTHCGEQHCLLNHARLRLLLGLVTPVLGCSSLVASNAAFRTGCSMLSPAARHVALMLHSGLVSLVAVEAAHRPRRGESTSVVSPAPRGTPAACVLCKSTRHDPAHVAWSRREENIARKASGFASLDVGQNVGRKPPTSGRWEAIRRAAWPSSRGRSVTENRTRSVTRSAPPQTLPLVPREARIRELTKLIGTFTTRNPG